MRQTLLGMMNYRDEGGMLVFLWTICIKHLAQMLHINEAPQVDIARMVDDILCYRTFALDSLRSIHLSPHCESPSIVYLSLKFVA